MSQLVFSDLIIKQNPKEVHIFEGKELNYYSFSAKWTVTDCDGKTTDHSVGMKHSLCDGKQEPHELYFSRIADMSRAASEIMAAQQDSMDKYGSVMLPHENTQKEIHNAK